MVRRVAPAAGRGRVKLARLLLAAGVRVEPEDIEPRGGRRRNRTAGDGERWEAYEAFAQGLPGIAEGFRTPLLSYATVGKLVQAGGVELERDGPTWLVWPQSYAAHCAAEQARVSAEAEARDDLGVWDDRDIDTVVTNEQLLAL